MRLGSGLAAVLLLSFATMLAAQPREENPLTLVVAPTDTVAAVHGDTALAQITLKVTPGYHVNANPAASEYYIPLEVKLDSTEIAYFLAPRYPSGKRHRLEGESEDLLVYDGAVTIDIPLIIGADVKSGTYSIKGRVEFQSCDDRVCFFPEERPLRVTLTVR
ncbi:protein-disulfide reductase DsbD N-terminal domain-containing protein [bacterium]|nr:protein-disulfide reductase DsbD N-terminal domain-containing protein [bacterium]MBU1984984.1 protein-disulfide reductase DsbD N-terminal domain-containing protein [bacterium]